MRRVTADGPGVVEGQLIGLAGAPIPVGSAAWYAWLAALGPEHRAFYFADAPGTGWPRARREWRRKQPYWYVKVRIGTDSRRFYLGAPAHVDSARLAVVAADIAAARDAVATGSNPFPKRPVGRPRR